MVRDQPGVCPTSAPRRLRLGSRPRRWSSWRIDEFLEIKYIRHRPQGLRTTHRSGLTFRSRAGEAGRVSPRHAHDSILAGGRHLGLACIPDSPSTLPGT